MQSGIRYSVTAVRDPDRLTSYLLELLSPLGAVSARPMFGGVGLFHNGMMFGLIAREELFFQGRRHQPPRVRGGR